MKLPVDIYVEIAELEPEFGELGEALNQYFDTCQKLHNTGKEFEKAAAELNAPLAGKSLTDVQSNVTTARFALREQGLMLLKASRQLSQMSAKCLSLSEKLAATVSRDEDEKA